MAWRGEWTPERRAATAERARRHLHTAEVRQKISVANHGRHRGVEAVGYSYVKGYKILTGQQGHPLATHDSVAEHRFVLYEQVGPGPHPCHWCGELFDWGGGDGIQPDHLDGDKLNNDLANLVVSCGVCNRLRGQAGNPIVWSR